MGAARHRRRRAARPVPAARPLPRRGVRRGATRSRRQGVRTDRATRLPRQWRRPRPRAAVDHLRVLGARLQRSVGARALSPAAPPRCAALEPGQGRRDAVGGMEHRGQLRHQHQLAELRRRVDHGAPHPDGGPDRAELRVGRGGHGRRHRPGAGVDPCPQGHDRQLLGRPRPRHHPGSRADQPRPGRGLRRRRRGAELPRRPHGDDGRGRQAGDPGWPGGLPGGDQAARYQRRRLLQRQLGASLREPERLHERAADHRPAGDPLRPVLRLRANGQGQTTGIRRVRGDVRAVAGRRPHRDERWSRTATRTSRRRASTSRSRRSNRAAPWRARR